MKRTVALLLCLLTVFTCISSQCSAVVSAAWEIANFSKLENIIIERAKSLEEFSEKITDLISDYGDSAGYTVEYDEEGRPYISNPYSTKRLIVRMGVGYTLSYTCGAETAICDGEGRYVLQYASSLEAKTAQSILEKDPRVSSVTADKPVKFSAVKTDSLLEKYNLDRYAAERIESDRFISYLKKKNYTTKITVAVVDSGIDTGHEMFKGRLVQGYDYLENDKYPLDSNGHGTHVAGIIADNTPDTVKIMPIRCFNDLGESTELLIALSIEKAIKSKVDVINMSFGGVCGDDSCEISLAVNKAAKKGIVCIAAAGNEYSDTADACPAKNKNCITVSAVDRDDRLADFSNYGNEVDIAAPGVDIYSSVPRTEGMYYQMSGTSMAAPFVTAAAAMILTMHPSLTPAKVKTHLAKATVDLGIKGKDKVFGEGVLDLGVYLGDKKAATGISIFSSQKTAYVSKNLSLPSEYIYAEVTPFNATDKSYTVSYSDKSIAKYDGFGMVGLKNGTVTVKLTLANKKSDSFKVTSKSSNFWIDYAAASYGKGKGTQNNPYIITTASQLAKISLDAYKGKLKDNTYFKLGKSISLKGKNWYPINAVSKQGDALRINLDGNGYTVSGLTIGDSSMGVYAKGGGLFYTTRGEIKNLNLTSVNINLTDALYGGAFCASFGGFMKNCRASGKVKAKCAGGLVGDLSLWGGTAYTVGISNCKSSVAVTGLEYAGGIVGSMLCGRINNCIFEGSTKSNELLGYSGGICGAVSSVNAIGDNEIYAENTTIINCISVTNIAGIKAPYSVKGKLYKPVISGCFYSGSYSSGVLSDFHSSSTSAKKVSLSNFKLKSFFTKSSNWNESFPWEIGTLWAVGEKTPKLIKQKDRIKTSYFGYVDLGNEIVVNSYNGKETSITIPSKIDSKPVRYVDSNFLSENTKIKSITLPSSVKVLSPLAFNKANLPYLSYVKLGGGLKTIGSGAFYKVNIPYITIPESVTGISRGAFYDCGKLKYAFFSSRVSSSWSEDAFHYINAKPSLKVYYPRGTLGWARFSFNNAENIRHDMSKTAVVYISGVYAPEAGGTGKIYAKALPESAKVSLKYDSSNSAVATVNSQGVITAKKKGNVTITVKSSDGYARASRVITVK